MNFSRVKKVHHMGLLYINLESVLVSIHLNRSTVFAFQLTYILVGYGTYPTVGSAIILALVRIAGIVAGGVVSLILAVLILPRSANIEACRETKRALKLLIELNQEVWKGTSSPIPAEL